MARKSMAYDHPAYITRMVAPVSLPATAASTTVRKFVAFTDIKVKSIGGLITIKGTSTGAVNHGWKISTGATSISVWSLNTDSATALHPLAPLTTDLTLASGNYIDFTTLADSATLAAELYIEYELIPGASVTV